MGKSLQCGFLIIIFKQQRMIYMKKLSAVICLIFLFVFIAGTAVAQKNANAYFLLDTDLATSGYQSMGDVMNIGARAMVGFAIYAKQWEEAGGFTVTFEWDGTKAEYRAANSGPEILDDDININGADITLGADTNILGGSMITAGESSSAGMYTNNYALSGQSASEEPEGLVFLAVFRTATGFQTTDALAIKASVAVSDGSGSSRFLGTRYFNVNQSVDVKPATWKEVKENFKDF
jgi:hypothetical protein